MAKTGRAPGKAKAKQTYIPGTEPLKIEEIEDCFASYEMHKSTRLAALEAEKNAKTELIELLRKHSKTIGIKNGEITYKSIDQQKTVTVDHEDKYTLKVSKIPQED